MQPLVNPYRTLTEQPVSIDIKAVVARTAKKVQPL